MTSKQIRAAFRSFHAMREYASQSGEFEIAGPGGQIVSLLDMERMIGSDSPLPPRTKEALILSLVEDMSPEAVASDMGISPGTVAGLVNGALKTIETEWAD